ncbi:MAG: hypothetical protein OQJ97_16020 [Rhodospirillales bacterium]|nr:hypothetical protein [Rhodospirillales bacterium]
MSKNAFKWSLIFILLVILAATIYLVSIDRFFDALALWGVASIGLWFMLRIMDQAQKRANYLNEPEEAPEENEQSKD